MPASPVDSTSQRVAVLLPCYNEAITIGKVVADFRAALPDATIYIFDNHSSDDTARIAAEAGATVVHSPRQGKGHVIQHMFDTATIIVPPTGVKMPAPWRSCRA